MTNTSPRILPDISTAKSVSSTKDDELVVLVRAMIAQVDCKTAPFVQLVITRAKQLPDTLADEDIASGLAKSKSVTSPKGLIAKWRRVGLYIGDLLPTCRLVAGDLTPKPAKVAKPKAGSAKASKPKLAKKAKQIDYGTLNLLFPGHLPQPTTKEVAKPVKAKKPTKKAAKPEPKPLDQATVSLLFPTLGTPELAMAA